MVEHREVHDLALPFFESAVISRQKLERYCLDPEHVSSTIGKSSGRDKARVFQAVLGFDKSDWELLRAAILAELPYCEAMVAYEDQHGTRYNVTVTVTGPNGNTAEVFTGWIIRPGSETPELTTARCLGSRS